MQICELNLACCVRFNDVYVLIVECVDVFVEFVRSEQPECVRAFDLIGSSLTIPVLRAFVREYSL